MKLRIKVTKTAEIDIDVNNEILDEVARHYDGDFKSWALDNYDEYTCSSDYYTDDFECTYDGKKAKELLDKAKEFAGISCDNNWSRDHSDTEKLQLSKIEKPEVELKKVSVDIELMKKIRLFTDVNDPST